MNRIGKRTTETSTHITIITSAWKADKSNYFFFKAKSLMKMMHEHVSFPTLFPFRFSFKTNKCIKGNTFHKTFLIGNNKQNANRHVWKPVTTFLYWCICFVGEPKKQREMWAPLCIPPLFF